MWYILKGCLTRTPCNNLPIRDAFYAQIATKLNPFCRLRFLHEHLARNAFLHNLLSHNSMKFFSECVGLSSLDGSLPNDYGFSDFVLRLCKGGPAELILFHIALRFEQISLTGPPCMSGSSLLC